jgi:hypothetical protein
MNSSKRIAPFRILAPMALALSTLAGCAGKSAGSATSAYDRACRSPYMNDAAARQAFWCWQQAGAKSYEEWMALRAADLPEHDAERVQVAAVKIGNRQ